MAPEAEFRGRIREAALAFTLFLLLGLAVPASAHRIEKRFAVKEQPVVTVRNASGKISVKRWQKPEVMVVANHASSKVEVDAVQMGNRVELSTHLLSEKVSPSEMTANYEITVPEETELQIRNDSGSVVVEKVSGDMNLDTVEANVDLQDVAGYLVIKTIGGAFACAHCTGRIAVNTISGNVRLAQTISGNVRSQSYSGNIFFDGEFLPGGIYRLANHSGLIEVRFSEYDNFDLSATSVYGKVENEAALKPPVHRQLPPAARLSRSLFGTYNAGQAKVELTSFNGTIKIRKR
jgi:DUF4097 and DUF4098 domain-containing protein YvlB